MSAVSLSVEEKYNQKLKELDPIERAACYNYFTKREAINKVLDVVRTKGMLNKSPFGNSNAKVIFVIDFDKTNEPCIEIVKRYFSANNADPYSAYYTPFTKTNDNKVNFALLTKEMEIMQPHRVIFITDMPMPEMEGSMSMTRNELEEILKFPKIKETATKEKTEEVNSYKVKLHKVMEFAILGK